MMPTLRARIESLRRDPTHRRIVMAAAIVATFAFAARLAGAAKEVLVARQFGTSDQVDAFLLAFMLPSFAITVVGGSLNTALMPAYVAVREERGAEAAQALLSTIMALSIALLAGAGLVLATVVPFLLPLLAPQFTPSKLMLTRELSYLLLPSLVLAGTTTTWTAALNARGRFAVPSAAGLAVPLASIVVLLALGHSFGIRALAVGMVLGYLVEAVCVGMALRREGISIRPRWGSGLTPAVRQVVQQYVPMVAGMLVLGTNPVIDQVMAARLGPGSVASLGYGTKVEAFAMGIGALSLGSAILPHFSRLAASKDWGALQQTIRTYSGLVMAVTVPLTVAAVALSGPIVRLLFQRGAFTEADTLLVASIQALSLAAIPFRLTGVLFIRFIMATSSTRVLMWISILNAAINVTANYVLSEWIGVAGIALSTSLVYTTACLVAVVYTRRRLRVLRAEPALEAVAELG